MYFSLKQEIFISLSFSFCSYSNIQFSSLAASICFLACIYACLKLSLFETMTTSCKKNFENRFFELETCVLFSFCVQKCRSDVFVIIIRSEMIAVWFLREHHYCTCIHLPLPPLFACFFLFCSLCISHLSAKMPKSFIFV